MSIKPFDNSKAKAQLLDELRGACTGAMGKLGAAALDACGQKLLQSVDSALGEFLLRGEFERAYVYISFLRTRMLERSPVYRVDVYDENWFLDTRECTREWDVSAAYERLFAKAASLSESLSRMYVTPWEFQRIFLKVCAEQHRSVARCVRKAARQIIRLETFEAIAQKGAQIWLGEYMDDVSLVYTSDDVETFGFL